MSRRDEKWVEDLDSIIASENRSINRTLKMSPLDAINNPEKAKQRWQQLFDSQKRNKFKFIIGQGVLVRSSKVAFSKSHRPSMWLAPEILYVKVRIGGKIPRYIY